jgi:hypothetical protein
VEANSTGGQGSRRAVTPSDDNDKLYAFHKATRICFSVTVCYTVNIIKYGCLHVLQIWNTQRSRNIYKNVLELLNKQSEIQVGRNKNTKKQKYKMYTTIQINALSLFQFLKLKTYLVGLLCTFCNQKSTEHTVLKLKKKKEIISRSFSASELPAC